MESRLIKISTIVLFGFLFNSCATLFLGTNQKVTLSSSPQGASVFVNGKGTNEQTPCTIQIPKKNPKTEINNNNEVVYTFKKEGYADGEYRNTAKVNGLVYVDYLFYIVPGLVDYATKAHRVYEKQVAVNLQATGKSDFTAPKITMIYPVVSRGFKSIEQNAQITIKGNAIDENGISEVLINNEKVQLSENGDFTKIVSLNAGDNTFMVKATDTNKNAAVETFVVQRPETGTNSQNTQSTRNSQALNVTGKYYALIIGNNNYLDQSISALNEPIKDATKLYDVLTTKYTFDTKNVTFLKNATYEQMIQAFDDLSNKITADDNIIVFYHDMI